MRDIDLKILKFLVEGRAYSDTAVMKNLGISFEELQKSYEILTQEGYLENYTDYLARTQNSFNSQEAEGHSCSSCSNNVSEEDYKNIKVVTEKAVRKFS